VEAKAAPTFRRLRGGVGLASIRVSQTDSRTLTQREAEVLDLLAHGLSNGQLAEQLGVTVHAVKYHLASIYRKLGVSNRTEAAGRYFQHLAPWVDTT
jgi:DNA-binding NarL/FixJ family response regulator